MNIYKSGLGDNLMNPVFFTDAVRQYLKAEEELLMSLSTSYDTLIEIGCTAGRYAEPVTQLGKSYVGIDIADHHILQAAHLHRNNEKASFLCDDAHNLESILNAAEASTRNPLIFFPFNSFGNLDNGYAILETLKKMSIPFAVFTYATDRATTGERTTYYAASGFTSLVMEEEGSGVRFIDGSGLNTIAYSESWFERSFSSLHLPYHRIPFSSIGCCYTSF
jgi:hypothetical protein